MRALSELTTKKGVMGNKVVIDILKENKIVVGELPVVIDIQPTKTAGKSTVYVIGVCDLGVQDNQNTKSFDRMNSFELAAQEIDSMNIQRAKMTMTDEIIEANGIEKGAPLTIKIDGTDIESRIEVYEQREPFYAGQNPVQYTNKENEVVEVQRDGKSFYRDTKLTPASNVQHQLLGTSVASITE